MVKLVPYLFSEDAKSQAAFYTEALGGKILEVSTYGEGPMSSPELKDKVMHLCFTAAGTTFFMCDSPSPFERGDGMNLCLEFESAEEAHTAFDKLAAGGEVKEALKPQFWGALYGQLVDKYGVYWMITTEMNTEPS